MTDATELDLDAVRGRVERANYCYHHGSIDQLALELAHDVERLLAALDEARKQARDGTEFYATANAESMRRALAAEARAEAAEKLAAVTRYLTDYANGTRGAIATLASIDAALDSTTEGHE